MKNRGRLVLHGGDVLTMADGAALRPGHDVVVEAGRIVEVVPTRAAEEYTGCHVVDCAGKTVIPSLWDMHVHLFNDEFLDYLLSWGVTSVFNMWGFEKHLKWRRQIQAGKRRGPDIYTTGPIIDSLPTYPLIRIAKTAADARAAVLETKAAGYDYVKIYNNLTPEVYTAIADTAEEVGLAVIGHLPNCINTDYTPEVGAYEIRQKTIEHLLFVNDENLEKMIEAGIWLNPTFTVEQAYRKEGLPLAEGGEEELRSGIKKLYWWALGSQHKKPREGAQKTVRKELSYYDERFRTYLNKGGKVLLGTDSGFPGVIPGLSMHQELALAVEKGMEPYAALECATKTAAEFLGMGAESGTLEAGKRAEILVLRRSPLEDITATLDIDLLVHRYDVYTAEDLAATRRKARRRWEITVDTVFRRYMFTMAKDMLLGVFKKKPRKEEA